MSAHDVFNPSRCFDPELGVNANWNYGSPRKMGTNVQIQRPRFGPWSTREISDAGYAFTLTFADRPIEQVHYIQRFYHQFKFGFFTLIDHDNGGREHVGRFTSYSDDTQTANLKYTVQVTFEELPGCPMRVYPNDWAHQSHIQPSVDDYGNFLAASSNAATTAQAVPNATGPLPHPQELFLAAAATGDFLQTQYIGWGFRMSLRQAASLTVCDLYIDGVLTLAGIDLSSGTLFAAGAHTPMAQGASLTSVPLALSGGGVGTGVPATIVAQNLPLGAHLVKLVAQAPGQISAGGTGLIFPQIEVMH